jgi:hypothetical protein
MSTTTADCRVDGSCLARAESTAQIAMLATGGVGASAFRGFRAACDAPEQEDAQDADRAMLAYTDRQPGECRDYKTVESRGSDNYARLKAWRTDTFEITGGPANNKAPIKGYCSFRPINPCPCDTRTYSATLKASNEARKQAGQPLCATNYFASGCGPYDGSTFVRVDGAGESDTGWSCVASDYRPDGPTDPYRGRVAVTVSRTFPDVAAARDNGFSQCRTVTDSVRDVKTKKVKTVTQQLCSQTPRAFSDSRALTAVAAPGGANVRPAFAGISGNYPKLTAIEGSSMKAYPVHALLREAGADVVVADLPACKASNAAVSVAYNNIIRIRMEPSDPDVKSGKLPAQLGRDTDSV